MSVVSLRAALALLLFLLGLTVGGFIPSALLSSLIGLAFVLIALAADRMFSAKSGETLPRPSLMPKALFPSVLLFPILLLSSVLFSYLLACLFRAAGLSVPTVTHDLPSFLSSVLIAPLAEELLFRHLLYRLYLPYGRGASILLTALLFALAHGSFYQMPYALLAGLLLGTAAAVSGSLLLPLLFHVGNNALAFFADFIPLPLLFGTVGGGAALSALALLFLRHRFPTREKGRRGLLRDILRSPLPIYALLMLALACCRLL